MPGYSTTTPGLDEARLDAVKAVMVGRIADLNTAFASITPTIAIGSPLTSACIHIGDPETLPDLTTNPLWLAVVGGGRQDAQDMDITLQATGMILHHKLYTNIYLYFHPDALPATDVLSQAEQRERARARVTDWLRGDCFNLAENMALTLASQEYQDTGDRLGWSYIRSIKKGWVLKSFGQKVWLYHAHYLLEGELYGGY